MSTASLVPPRTAPAMSLDVFLDCLRSENPFFVDRVDRPVVGSDTSVDSIHAAALAKIIALARQACTHQRGVGAMLWGEAGIGKSHLLARLANWAWQGRHAVLVSLPNLLCSPENLPRYVLKCTLNVLSAGQVHDLHATPLFVLVNGLLRQALGAGHRPISWQQAHGVYTSLVDRLAVQDAWRAVLIDRTIFDVFFRFFESAYQARVSGDAVPANLALRWLSGDWLDPAEAARIGLRAAGQPVRLEDEQHIKKVFVALTQMAQARRQPLVLCFDQVDNLDEPQLRSLARFLHDLLDSAGNLLVVTSGLQENLVNAFQAGIIHKPAWDRLAQHKIELLRIGKEAGRYLLEVRLEKFLERFLGIGAIKQLVQTDTLFPLGRDWFDRRLGDLADVRPRDIINWARDRWERQQEAAARLAPLAWLGQWDRDAVAPLPPERKADHSGIIDAAIDARIAEAQQRYREQPATLPADADHLVGLVYTLLDQCRPPIGAYALIGMQRMPPKSGAMPPYHLLVRQSAPPGGQEPRIGVAFLVTGSAQSAAAALRRISEDEQEADRAVLVTDVRQALPLAAKGQEYLEELQHRGTAKFQHIELSFDEYAYLAALRDVFSQARTGELEVELVPGRRQRLSETEVIASHHRRDRYRTSRLLRLLLAPAGV